MRPEETDLMSPRVGAYADRADPVRTPRPAPAPKTRCLPAQGGGGSGGGGAAGVVAAQQATPYGAGTLGERLLRAAVPRSVKSAHDLAKLPIGMLLDAALTMR